MRRLAVLLALAAAATGLESAAGDTCRSHENCATAPAALATAAAREPFLGIVVPEPSGSTRSILARLDPLTLNAVSPSVEMGEYHGAWSLSPDGSQLALGISSGVSLVVPPRPLRGRIGIIIVDLEAMKIVQEVETGGYASALAWLAPRRLVAAVPDGGTVLVDPRTGQIVRRGLLSRPLASARAADRAVLLSMGPHRTDGGRGRRISAALRLAIVDAQGRVRSITLDRMRLASREDARWDEAALTVDAAQRRAYVVAAGAPVAEVDLRTMRASYRRLDFLFQRPGEVQGTARPERLLQRSRDAIWLGRGQLLVSGHDSVAGASGREISLASGAMLVDTVSWRWQTIDTTASGAAFAAGRLLAFGRTGLRGYARGGRRVFHLLRGRRASDLQVAGGRAYARTPRAVRVVDVRRGKVVGNIVPPRDLIDVISTPP